MKLILFFFFLTLLSTTSHAVIWSYQVNTNSTRGPVQTVDSSRVRFEASGYTCEVTPVVVKDKTEYRSLSCGVGTSVVSTGGLCTQKGSKVISVQYAILNISAPKELVNVVVSCRFD